MSISHSQDVQTRNSISLSKREARQTKLLNNVVHGMKLLRYNCFL